MVATWATVELTVEAKTKLTFICRFAMHDHFQIDKSTELALIVLGTFI